MNINFVTVTNESMASYRYRIFIPAIMLAKRGHLVRIVTASQPDAEIAVYSKHYNEKDVDDAQALQMRGGKVIFDICDMHDIPHYERMRDIADRVTVSTEALAAKFSGAVLVQDPYEYPEKLPRFQPEEIIKVLWYGHASNINALANVWEELHGNHVLILTNPEVADMTNMPITPWSLARQMQGLAECDVVIVPVEDLPKKHTKSANRMIEAIRSGRFVVASSTPSHDEFKQWMYVGNIGQGLKWVRQHRDEIEERIREAQNYIRERYSPETIGEKWEKVCDFGNI